MALLGFLDDEPQWARLLIVEAPLAGAVALERRRRLFGVLGGLVEAGGAKGGVKASAETSAEIMPSPALTAELVLGGVFSVIHARLLDREGRGPLVELAPSLMSFIGASYLESSPRAAERPIRATYRTTCVLRAISTAPRSSNREVAEAAGVADEGQTSKLLGRLERRGLIENVGLGAAYGEPNAWLLTPDGRRVVAELNREGLAPTASRRTLRLGGAERSRRPHEL